jgi:Bifunctional DNA primase/polymerase, N-terminal
MTADFATAALEAVNLDLPVFPLRADSKEPALRGWQTRATNDPERVFRLAREFPTANVGVAMRDTLLVAADQAGH